MTVMSDRSIAIDWLNSLKGETIRDAHSILNASNSILKPTFERLYADHYAMFEEISGLAHRRGWYRVPPATHQVLYQIRS